jgi:hypothetical protein
MRRLLRCLPGSDDDTVNQRLAQHSEALIEWNDKLGSFYARLSVLATHAMSVHLEEGIQTDFVSLWSQVESLTNKRLSNEKPDRKIVGSLDEEMNRLQGKIIQFTKTMLRLIRAQKVKTYVGTRVDFDESTLEIFPTWELVKALFKPRKEPLSIIRTPADMDPPRLGFG